MEKKRVFILSVSSDIGHALALEYVNNGYEVIGTFRQKESVIDLLPLKDKIHLLFCDATFPQSIELMVNGFRTISKLWDIFISCIGTMEPIGPFFSQDFNAWEQSVIINSIAQLRVLRELWPYRREGQICNVAFFAGGGTNNAVPNYSAYIASKIFLIKMCELLNSENPDLNVFIVGPGFLPTKIHYSHILDFLRPDYSSYKDIYDCINWCIAQGKEVSGGRNFSVVYDEWRNEGQQLIAQLLKDENKFKLRRFRNKE